MGRESSQLENMYAVFVSAKFYCEECDSYQYSDSWDRVAESDVIFCPNHYPEDDD